MIAHTYTHTLYMLLNKHVAVVRFFFGDMLAAVKS